MKKILIIMTSMLLLFGCQTVSQGKHQVKPDVKPKVTKTQVSEAHQKKLCFMRCEQILKSCMSQCHQSCRQCKRAADRQACKSYKAYYNQMKVKGTYRPRDWLSFRDPLQCRKVSCNCPADMNVCIQQCGGTIQKKLQATPYCE